MDCWHVHTLVFDLDDTLFAERDYVLSGFRAAGEWLEAHHGIGGFAAAATTLFDQGVRGTIFNQVLLQLGRAADPSLIAALVGAYRAHRPTLALSADALACLEWARGRVRFALITDGYGDVQQKKIAALGLEDRIECRVVTDLLGRECWKPNPAGFLRVMEALPGPTHGYVYIGDNPRKDFIAPRALGWRTVRIRREGGEHARYQPSSAEAADRDVISLREIFSFIEPVVLP